MNSFASQICADYFHRSGALAYSEYNKNRDQNSKSIVEVKDFKNNNWKFWLGSSAKQYYKSKNSRAKTTLTTIHQKGKTSKVYLLIVEEAGEFNSGLVVAEFNLFTKRSKTIASLRGNYYSPEITIPKDQDYIILSVHESGTARNSNYKIQNYESHIIFPYGGTNFKVTHRSDLTGRTRYGRSRTRSYNYGPEALIQTAHVDGKTLYSSSLMWDRTGTYVLSILENHIRIDTLNLETRTLQEFKTYSEEQILKGEYPELIEIFGNIQLKLSR